LNQKEIILAWVVISDLKAALYLYVACYTGSSVRQKLLIAREPHPLITPILAQSKSMSRVRITVINMFENAKIVYNRLD
jgi:hypothetical protein